MSKELVYWKYVLLFFVFLPLYRAFTSKVRSWLIAKGVPEERAGAIDWLVAWVIMFSAMFVLLAVGILLLDALGVIEA